MFNKKGQLTVFIALGLVLVIAVSIYLYIAYRPVGIESSVMQAPERIRPVAAFVTDCLSQAGEEGVRRVAEGGGYIDLSSYGLRASDTNPTESDAVPFAPGSSLVLPYWWYLKSPNDCVGACEFSSLAPPLFREGGERSIETQLDSYVTAKVKSCVDDIALPEFSVNPIRAPEVRTTIGAEGVSFALAYPLEIVREGERFEYSEYAAHVDAPLSEMYNVAKEIANLESKGNFLERHVMQTISSYSGTYKDALPPIAAATFDLDKGKRWVKADVQRNVRNLLSAYIPLLRVFGTRNAIFLETPGDVRDEELWQRTHNLNAIIALKENHPELEIRFSSLDWWPEHFDLNCRGQVCAPDSFVNTWGFPFGFQKYNFAYDVSLPVLVEIRSPDSLGRKGLNFNLMLEANVRNNDPLPFFFEPNLPYANYTPVSGSLMCDPEQRTGPEAEIRVVDGLTGAPLDLPITFSCGPESCGMGDTVNGVLRTKMPVCLGGTLEAIGAGRLLARTPLNTVDDTFINVTIESWEPKTVAARAMRLQFTKSNGRWSQTPYRAQHSSYDETILILERTATGYDDSYVAAADICGTETGTVDLVPGNYTISVITMYHGPITFPPREECVDLVTEKQCYKIPDEPLYFGKLGAECDGGNPLLIGTSTVRWELTPGELARGPSVVFKTLVAAIDDIPENERVLEDIDSISLTEQRAPGFQPMLRPEVVLG